MGQQWSEALLKLAVWLSGLVTFPPVGCPHQGVSHDQAEAVLERVGQVPMSDSTAWRQVQTCGAQARALEAERRGPRVTPVELALSEQTRFPYAKFAEAGVTLREASGAAVTCRLPPELAEFVRRFHAGENVEQQKFQLESELKDSA